MSILMQQSDGILQHIYDQIFTFKKGSRLSYIKQKIKIEDIFIFSELLTSLGDYIIQENLIDTNNRLIVICDDFLSFALCCRMIHIQQIETRILHDIEPLTLSLWRGKKYDSSGVSTFLYYFCKSQSKVSKIPHNALLSISDLILDNWELWDHPFNHSRVGWGQISPFAINQLYDPHTSKRWHRK